MAVFSHHHLRTCFQPPVEDHCLAIVLVVVVQAKPGQAIQVVVGQVVVQVGDLRLLFSQVPIQTEAEAAPSAAGGEHVVLRLFWDTFSPGHTCLQVISGLEASRVDDV